MARFSERSRRGKLMGLGINFTVFTLCSSFLAASGAYALDGDVKWGVVLLLAGAGTATSAAGLALAAFSAVHGRESGAVQAYRAATFIALPTVLGAVLTAWAVDAPLALAPALLWQGLLWLSASSSHMGKLLREA